MNNSVCILKHGESWLCFENPRAVLQARTIPEVLPCLQAAESEAANGRYAVGFVTYEAASAFDSAMVTRPSRDLPLAWFGIYDRSLTLAAPSDKNVATSVSEWKADTNLHEFQQNISKIKDYIAQGDTYQVNYSFRLNAPFTGNALDFFAYVCRAQPAKYSAYLDIGDHVIASASPELFFELKDDRIMCRPMKGTAARGVNLEKDHAIADQLLQSAKNRAENIMIVDMIRNDLGRIAKVGSVKTDRLFELEKYPTLFQLTSTVTAQTSASLVDIFRALFPCASVTGAPKIRTMEIISELEKTPRGIYTGAIGFMGPHRQAQFSVAIRTAHITKDKMEYGIGSGIVWDSDPMGEYNECLTKALILSEPQQNFQLIETLRWEPQSGYYFFDLHLKRLLESATYFNLPIHIDEVRQRLLDEAKKFEQPQRVRFLLDHGGFFSLENVAANASFQNDPKTTELSFKVRLATEPVSSANRFLYHKTTIRKDATERVPPPFDDIIFWNERGEITESTIANVVIEKDGVFFTPSVSSGLLAGTFREHLLQQKIIQEKVITLLAYEEADAVYLINSVRGWIKT